MHNTGILVIAATNRKNSLSAQLTDYYAELLRRKGGEVEVYKLVHLPEDFTARALYENSGKHAGFNVSRRLAEQFSRYVFVVPEYNSSFPGVFKAWIDGLAFPSTFKGKRCALVGVSQGPQGGAFAMSHLTDIFHYLGMQVYPLKLRLANIKDSRLETILASPQYVQLLEEQAAGILSWS